MAKTIIHVNMHNIRYNTKHGNIKPVITVKQGKKNTYCNDVVIDGPARVVYSPEKPLSCGARVWIETESPVNCINPMSFQETKDLECKNA